MGKSLRSKVKKRWRSLKRQHIDEIKVKADIQELSNKLQATIQNRAYRVAEPKNAFLYPQDPEAHFPQYKPPQMIDFRSSSIPGAGTQYSGSRREKKNVKPQVTTTIVREDIEQEVLISNQDEAQDDLASAMGTLGVQSKREKRKSKQERSMGDEKQIKSHIAIKKKLTKRARNEQQTRKSKRIVNF